MWDFAEPRKLPSGTCWLLPFCQTESGSVHPQTHGARINILQYCVRIYGGYRFYRCYPPLPTATPLQHIAHAHAGVGAGEHGAYRTGLQYVRITSHHAVRRGINHATCECSVAFSHRGDVQNCTHSRRAGQLQGTICRRDGTNRYSARRGLMERRSVGQAAACAHACSYAR
jgi:hypothetical protein